MSITLEPTEPEGRGTTAGLCRLLYVLAREPGWAGTRALAEAAGVQVDVARRMLRELAAHDWSLQRAARAAEATETEQWLLGPALADLAREYVGRLELAADQLAAERDLLSLPLTPYQVPTLPALPPLADPDPVSVQHRDHRGTAVVVLVMQLLLAHAHPLSAMALSRATGLHRATVAGTLGELAAHGWVVALPAEAAMTWRLGPGLARLAAQHDAARRLPTSFRPR